MNVQFESRFTKDLKRVKDKLLLSNIKKVIDECKNAQSLAEISNLKKLKDYQAFYRIRLGDYRIGLEIIDDQIVFTRFLHRKEVYRFFP